jgi:hypothetical protein
MDTITVALLYCLPNLRSFALWLMNGEFQDIKQLVPDGIISNLNARATLAGVREFSVKASD